MSESIPPGGYEGSARGPLAISRLCCLQVVGRIASPAPFELPPFRDRHSATTCTETSIRSQASDGPAQEPESGEAWSCSRATPTETCSEPASLLFVGSKPRQPAPGM